MALKQGYVNVQGKTPEATMASALYTDIKRKEGQSVFIRPHEGLFGLREWWDMGYRFMVSHPPHRKAFCIAFGCTSGLTSVTRVVWAAFATSQCSCAGPQGASGAIRGQGRPCQPHSPQPPGSRRQRHPPPTGEPFKHNNTVIPASQYMANWHRVGHRHEARSPWPRDSAGGTCTPKQG